MCQFFSAVVTRDHRVLFTEENSHETVIVRARLRDTSLSLRHFARVELRPDGAAGAPLRVDEPTTPRWWNPVTDRERVRIVAARVRTARATYEATMQAPWATYETARATYEATMMQAPWASYQAAWAAAQVTYDAAVAADKATYMAAVQTLEGYVPPRS